MDNDLDDLCKDNPLLGGVLGVLVVGKPTLCGDFSGVTGVVGAPSSPVASMSPKDIRGFFAIFAGTAALDC